MLTTPFGDFRTKEELAQYLKDHNIPVTNEPIKIRQVPNTPPKLQKVTQNLDDMEIEKNEPTIPSSFDDKPKEIIIPAPPVPYTTAFTTTPIKLQYKYIGQCPKCGTAIVTVMLNLSKTLFAVALCPKCNESVQETKVTPLE